MKQRRYQPEEMNMLIDSYMSKLEENLYKSSTKFGRVLDSLIDGYFEVDDDFRYLEANRRGLDMMGASSKDEILGKQIWEYFPIDFESRFMPAAERSRQTGKAVVLESYYKPLDRWYESTIYPNESGFSVLARDTTERRRIVETRLRLASIVESSDDAILSKDLDGYINSWNQAAEKLYGYREDEIIGKHVTILFPPEARKNEYEMIMGMIRRGRSVERLETKRQTKDGQIRYVQVTVSPIRGWDNTISGASTITRDITDRRQIEERRIMLERMRGDFVGVASHELKTPVTSMKAYVQILQRKLERKGETETAQSLARIDAQIDRLNSLIKDLLDVTQIEAGRLEMSPSTFDYCELVRETVEVTQLTTEKHTITINRCSGIRVRGDRDRVGQVLINLLGNAIKYSPNGGTIEVDVKRTGQTVTTGVTDHGIGVPEDLRERLFERFFRVDGETARNFSGLGLGLFICGQIIMQMKGKIWVESEPGKGSTFFFTLPAKSVESKKASKHGK
jgi:PAS domain S-box-containing protein